MQHTGRLVDNAELYHKELLNGDIAINVRTSIIYGIAIIVTIFLGLVSRSGFFVPSSFVYLYVGDALWACLIYWSVCFLKPSSNLSHQGIFALTFCFCIELSQLYQAQWINEIRHTTIGGLVLGFGFKLSDLLAYTLGVLLGAYLNFSLVRKYFSFT